MPPFFTIATPYAADYAAMIAAADDDADTLYYCLPRYAAMAAFAATYARHAFYDDYAIGYT